MRIILSAFVLSAASVGLMSASAGVKPGDYVCRTPAGTETGATFRLGRDGSYGDLAGNVSGRVNAGSGELIFRGGEKDGSRALVISDTRIKVGKRIFCEWEAPKAKAAPVVEAAAATAAPERPKPKLIVVKPDLRR